MAIALNRFKSANVTSQFPCLLAILFFIVAASFKIRNPGLYYDEMIFVSGAHRISDALTWSTSWVDSLRQLPIMVFRYIGALKAWLFFPIFYCFGYSPLTIRLPAILISAGTIYINYLTARKWLGPFYGMAMGLLLATSPSLVFQSRVDWGPVVLMLFCKAISLYYFASLIQSRKISHLIYMVLAMVMGTYDKLNFVWIVTAFLLSSLIVYHSEILDLLKKQSRRLLIYLGIATIITMFVFATKIIPLVKLPDFLELSNRVEHIWSLYTDTMSNGGLHICFKHIPYIYNIYNWLFPFSIFIFITIALSRFLQRDFQLFCRQERPRLFVFFILLFLFTFIQIVVTPEAGGPHHVMTLMPFDLFAFVISVSFIEEINLSRLKYVSRRLAVAIIFSVVCINSYAVIKYDGKFAGSHDYYARWSPAIYRLAATLVDYSASVDCIVFTDWGMALQVMALVNEDARLKVQNF
ncbi:MAG: ArnT family glycosyltransferase, partial [Syntrophobacteraceae bacterium]